MENDLYLLYFGAKKKLKETIKEIMCVVPTSAINNVDMKLPNQNI